MTLISESPDPQGFNTNFQAPSDISSYKNGAFDKSLKFNGRGYMVLVPDHFLSCVISLFEFYKVWIWFWWFKPQIRLDLDLVTSCDITRGRSLCHPALDRRHRKLDWYSGVEWCKCDVKFLCEAMYLCWSLVQNHIYIMIMNVYTLNVQAIEGHL